MKRIILAGILATGLSACAGEEASDAASEEGMSEEVVAEIPASLSPFGDGYPNAGDPCMRLGESAATVDYLDDSAVLVGCPTPSDADALGGSTVATIEGVTIVSVPTGDANAGMPPVALQSPVAATPSSDDGEAACYEQVAETTGAEVIGTDRVETSEAGTAIYVNIEGAEAPWQCIVWEDGTVAGVMYTGDEGAL